jgi:hypothetical protein
MDYQKSFPLELSTVKPDFCGVCDLKYNIGDRIPKILVNCGHTVCSKCIAKYYRNQRVRCPSCKKLVKNLTSIETLPVNTSILGQIINSDSFVKNMVETTGIEKSLSDDLQNLSIKKMCLTHKHCDCLSNESKECTIVDLKEIRKLYFLGEENNNSSSKNLSSWLSRRMSEECNRNIINKILENDNSSCCIAKN